MTLVPAHAGAGPTPSGGTADCAILFQDACFSWSADSSVMAIEAHGSGGGTYSGAAPCRDVTFHSARRWWAGDMALVDLCLSVPSGSLVAVVGDVGAGRETGYALYRNCAASPILWPLCH